MISHPGPRKYNHQNEPVNKLAIPQNADRPMFADV
jgi:hypothetical protein